MADGYIPKLQSTLQGTVHVSCPRKGTGNGKLKVIHSQTTRHSEYNVAHRK